MSEDLSATEAARHFSEVLDRVEHQGASFTVVRNGKPVARLLPAASSNGADVLKYLKAHRPDPDWVEDLRAVRSRLFVEERDWPA